MMKMGTSFRTTTGQPRPSMTGLFSTLLSMLGGNVLKPYPKEVGLTNKQRFVNKPDVFLIKIPKIYFWLTYVSLL